MGPHLDEAVVGTNVDNNGMVVFGEVEWVYWCPTVESKQVELIHVEQFGNVVGFDVVGYQKVCCSNGELKNHEGL